MAVTTYMETILLEEGHLYNGAIITHDNMINIYKHFNSLNVGVYGTANPSSDISTISIEEITHQITRVYFKDPSDPRLYCSIRLLDTLNGRIVKSLIDRGMKYYTTTVLLGIVSGTTIVDPILHAVHIHASSQMLDQTVSVPLKEI